MLASNRGALTRFGVTASLMAGLLIAQPVAVNATTGETPLPYSIRYESTMRGDILLIGNSLLACSPGEIGTKLGIRCEDAQFPTVQTVGTDNNDFNMKYIDVDGDATTANSSSANLNLPAGAQVTFAGLYWGAYSNADGNTDPARANVKLHAPNSAGYVNLVASRVDDLFINELGNSYQGFADITEQVKAAGAGTYTVAGVLALQGAARHAGWAIVVAYTKSTESLRNLIIYDNITIKPYEPLDIPLSGFLTPSSGTVVTTLGLYGFDGDRGSIGDQLKLNNTVISDAQNPPNNPFNSSISDRGANVTTRNPAFVNTMSVDVDLFDVSGILPNSVSTATLSIDATAEKFLPGLATFSTLVFQPAIQIQTLVNDLNGGEVNAGDTLEYTVVMTNAGSVPATDTRLNITLPADTTYEANSFTILSNAGGATGAQTDAAGDDLGEVSGGTITARLGTGSNASAGGSIAVDGTASVKYRVKVTGTITSQTILANKSEVTSRSASNPSVVLTSTNTLNVLALPKLRVLMPVVIRQ